MGCEEPRELGSDVVCCVIYSLFVSRQKHPHNDKSPKRRFGVFDFDCVCVAQLVICFLVKFVYEALTGG